LDNHHYQITPHAEECLLAAGEKRSYTSRRGNTLAELQQFMDEKKGWFFGHLGYDLKNETEALYSALPDPIGFPDVFFFEPEFIIRLTQNEMTIEGNNAADVYDEILSAATENENEAGSKVSIQQRFTKNEYLAVVEKLKKHIHRGDCYEINFCQEFFIEQVNINPVAVYK